MRRTVALAELIGDSEPIRRIRALVDRLADSDATVLVTGPSGSGKEVVARLLHQRGRRATQPFVALNCGALPAELIESELFGHEAGAFTGASRARAGHFERADRGTLFLDEVGDMPAAMQVKLLRALETRVVERVGGMLGIAVDVRVVAATNVDFAAAIAAGRFREDLYYRLAVVELRLPALAQRREDIPLLVRHILAATPQPGRLNFTPPALALLAELPWRGNVRELRNFVDRAAALHAGETLGPADVLQLTGGSDPWRAPPAAPAAATDEAVDLKRVLDGIEQDYIERALGTGGGVAAAARRLGLRRTTLIEKMRRLDITRPLAG